MLGAHDINELAKDAWVFRCFGGAGFIMNSIMLHQGDGWLNYVEFFDDYSQQRYEEKRSSHKKVEKKKIFYGIKS